jgi:predicted secreted hydrolase
MPDVMKWVALPVVLAAVIIGIGWFLWGGRGPAVPVSGPSFESLIPSDTEGFARVAVEDTPLDFPADHGAHPGFRSELWGLFGQLEDEQGIRYDFQLSLTRLALSAAPAERASAWAANEVYRGQLAIMQSDRRGIRSAERLTRAALGLAGGRSEPPSVWIEDWSLSLVNDEPGRMRMALVAEAAGSALALDLAASKSPLSLGDLGLLGRDFDDIGLRAYLLPRLVAEGTLTSDGEARSVRGYGWLDHAWGALPTSTGQVGLNRFAIQLDDDRELICLQLRREDGTGTPIPACALILADGRVQSFQRREIRLEPTSRWLSPRTGSGYSVAWRLSIPILDMELELSPLVQDQESEGAIRIWSGAVQASGRQKGQTIGGRGRIETTADPGPASGA